MYSRDASLTGLPVMRGVRALGDAPKGLKRTLVRQLLIEAGPLLAFFLVFLAADLIWATAVYAVATVAALAMSWILHRRVAVLPLVTAGLVLIFAGLTIALDNATFIMIKPTVVNGFYAVVLGVGWLFGFRLVQRVLGTEVRLSEAGQRALTLRTAAYLAGLALANEVAWRTLPIDLWVGFKVFVIIACNIGFGLAQVPLVRRHMMQSGPTADVAG